MSKRMLGVDVPKQICEPFPTVRSNEELICYSNLQVQQINFKINEKRFKSKNKSKAIDNNV